MPTNLYITNSQNTKLKVSWSDTENLKKWIATQRTRSYKIKDLPDVVFFAEYQNWIQWYWNQIEKIGELELPNEPHILDIGSGIGIIDLFLHQMFPTSHISLIDKNDSSPINGNLYGPLHPFYNSWDPTIDAIKTTNLNIDNFKFLLPEDNWATDVDLITSHFSWCWHYDVQTYLDKVYDSLKQNGKLILTIRFTNNENIIKILNDKFGSVGNMIYFPKFNQIDTEQHLFDAPGENYGCIGMWVKNR